MEKSVSNKTLWIFKRAEFISHPQKRKAVVETKSNRSSVRGISREPSQSKISSTTQIPQTPQMKREKFQKNKSISELPSLSNELLTPLTKNNKKLLKAQGSLVLDKYHPILPSIKQINPDMVMSQKEFLNINHNNNQEVLSPSDLFESPLIKKRLIHSKRLDIENNTALTIRYNTPENLVALGCEDGVTRVIEIQNGRIHKLKSSVVVPVTSVRWSPRKDNVLFQTKANGTVEIFSLETNSVVFSFQEEGNFINCSDHNDDGTLFSTAGQDARIRVYDSQKPEKVLHVYSRLANPTHANRIYSLRFHPDNNYLIATGGWDESLILWDIRTPHKANFIYGPLICGDSMDIRGNDLLTGSWRESKQLQIWDIRTLKEKSNIEWLQTNNKEKPFIYSCIFEKNYGKYIIAGSSGVNEIRLYENGKKYDCLDSEVGFKKGIYSLDSSKLKNLFCYGSEKCGVYSIY